MATRLSAFATAVHAQLEASGVTGVAKYDDREAQFKHGEKRRILWVTDGGTVEPTDQAGGRVSGSNRIPACKVRVERVDAYVFGGTREATEELLDALIAACVIVLGPRIEMPSYRWLSQEDGKAGSTLRTQLCVLTMNLRLPVAEEISPLTTITSTEHECGTLDANGNIVPQE